MKRDMELVRQILFLMEDYDSENDEQLDLQSLGPEFSERQVMYHMGLLYKAGFIEAYDSSGIGEEYYTPVAITWQGYEFVDAVRSQNVWNQVKEKAKDVGGSMPLETVKLLATHLIKNQLGI